MLNKLVIILVHCFQLLKKEPGQISSPSEFRHTLTVQVTTLRDDANRHTPPGSPATSRLRVARKYPN